MLVLVNIQRGPGTSNKFLGLVLITYIARGGVSDNLDKNENLMTANRVIMTWRDDVIQPKNDDL